MNVIVRDRQLGKTTELVRWLLGGRAINAWPGWSRVLVVADAQRAVWTSRHFHEADQWLRVNGLPPGLQKIVLTARDWRNRRPGSDRLITWALDDAEQIIAQYFDGLPAVMSMTGVSE